MLQYGTKRKESQKNVRIHIHIYSQLVADDVIYIFQQEGTLRIVICIQLKHTAYIQNLHKTIKIKKSQCPTQ